MRMTALTALAFLCGCSGPPDAPPSQSVAQPAGEPRILHFYAYPAAVSRSQSAQICYGVENASDAKIDPQPGKVPAYANRCLQVAPERTTEYTLTAIARDGRRISQQLTIDVSIGVKPAARPAGREGPAPARVTSFTVSPSSIAPGGNVTLCYETSDATNVRIEPPVVDFRLPARGCFGHAPDASTTYRLTASGPGGSDSREAAVTLR